MTERPLRILIVTPAYKPAWRFGGPAVSVSALAEHLAAAGHRVTVFTTNSNLDMDLDVAPDVPHDVDGVKVWYFSRSEPLKDWFPGVAYFSKSIGVLYSPRMKAALDRQMPHTDVVHTQLPFVYPTYAAARAARRHGVPLFYHQRGVFDPARLRFRGLKKRAYLALVEKPIMRRATTLFCLTDAETASFRALGASAPCAVVPNGITLAAPTGGGCGAVSAAVALRPGQPLILFMGRIHPIKGADVALGAFMDVAADFPDAVMVMAGPDEFGLVEDLRARVAALGLENRVIFPGMVEGAAKRDLLARADLFCLPSAAEGFSMAILEAMAAGTAVVISPGCHFDLVETAGAGRVVAADSDSLAVAFRSLLSSREALAEMGARARLLVEREFSWPLIAERTVQAYREGMARFRGLATEVR